MKCLRIKNGNMETLEYDDFEVLLKEEFKDLYESTDYVIAEDLDIRVFAGFESSLSSDAPTLYYRFNGELTDVMKGTLLFAKNGKTKWRSLSNSDLTLLKKRIVKAADTYEITY